MGGGLMELVARGAQDIYLTGNPQITFFKRIYKRHTNFSIESVEQTFSGDVNFGLKSQLVLKRSGDLVSSIILEIELPKISSSDNTVSWINSIGHALIEEVTLEIGGTLIDKHYGEWLEIWSELSLDYSKLPGFKHMVGNMGSSNGTKGPYTLYIPLQFWFCRNIGCALPLIALQYHDVVINVKFRKFDECWTNNSLRYYDAYQQNDKIIRVKGDYFNHDVDVGKYFYWPDGSYDIIKEVKDSNGNFTTIGTEATVYSNQNIGSQSNPKFSAYLKSNTAPLNGPNGEEPKVHYSILNCRAFCDYIYLDTSERRKFAQMKHTYLIEQLQFNGNKSYIEGQKSEKIGLDFNHPTKELIWIQQSDSIKVNNNWFNFSDSNDSNTRSNEPIDNVILYLNGQERFSQRKGSYFRMVQPYLRHTRIPSADDTKYIYTYSFGIKPEEHQPSGTCNFSRIDNSDIHIEFRDPQKYDPNSAPIPSGSIRIYALNYNILRIMNGMGGLAYSN